MDVAGWSFFATEFTNHAQPLGRAPDAKAEYNATCLCAVTLMRGSKWALSRTGWGIRNPGHPNRQRRRGGECT